MPELAMNETPSTAQRPTKVGFITNMYTPYKEAMFREIAMLVDLKVYYCSQKERDRDWEVQFSNTYAYELLPGKTFHFLHYKLHTNPGLGKRLEADQPDLVIVGEWCNPTVMAAPFILRAKGIPRILWSGSTEMETSWRRYLTYPLKRLIVAQYHGYVNYTTFAQKYVQSLGAPADKTLVAPVTIDTDFFHGFASKLRENPGREALRQKHFLAEGDIAIAFVGQMIHRKGVDLLIEALHRLNQPKVKVMLAGSGPERPSYEQLVAQRGLTEQVRFLGHCTQEQLVEMYVAADIFSLPSRQEPSGNVINEAMTVGLPAVISSQIGCDCIEDGVSGHIFKSEDIDDYVKCLKALIDDPQHRADASAAARRRLLYDYSIQMEARQFARAVEDTLGRLKRPFEPKAPLDSFLHTHLKPNDAETPPQS